MADLSRVVTARHPSITSIQKHSLPRAIPPEGWPRRLITYI